MEVASDSVSISNHFDFLFLLLLKRHMADLIVRGSAKRQELANKGPVFGLRIQDAVLRAIRTTSRVHLDNMHKHDWQWIPALLRHLDSLSDRSVRIYRCGHTTLEWLASTVPDSAKTASQLHKRLRTLQLRACLPFLIEN